MRDRPILPHLLRELLLDSKSLVRRLRIRREEKKSNYKLAEVNVEESSESRIASTYHFRVPAIDGEINKNPIRSEEALYAPLRRVIEICPRASPVRCLVNRPRYSAQLKEGPGPLIIFFTKLCLVKTEELNHN